jgi:arylformamidase
MMMAAHWPVFGADLPADLVKGGILLSGLYDLEPVRHADFVNVDLKLTPANVRRLSPAFFPRPRGPLYAVVGGQESDEHLRQNRLIRDQWGPSTVPVCETVVGKNHFDVLHELVDPDARVHNLALRLLGLD